MRRGNLWEHHWAKFTGKYVGKTEKLCRKYQKYKVILITFDLEKIKNIIINQFDLIKFSLNLYNILLVYSGV